MLRLSDCTVLWAPARADGVVLPLEGCACFECGVCADGQGAPRSPEKVSPQGERERASDNGHDRDSCARRLRELCVWELSQLASRPPKVLSLARATRPVCTCMCAAGDER